MSNDKKQFNVLIIEDDFISRKLLEKSFNKKFNKVVSCEDGLNGFLKFKTSFEKNEKFDLIVSDINMPKLNGLEMIEKIRKFDIDVPVVFVTARTELEYIAKSIELSAIGYLLKPLDYKTLDERINIILKDSMAS